MAEVLPLRGRAAWMSRAGLVALVLLVVQACWRGSYLLRGYYVQDDFRMLQLGGSSPLSWGYLFQEYAGHMWPGDFLIAWVTARVDPMSWTLTASTLLLLQLAAGVVMWLVLSRLMGASWFRVPVLAVFLFSPITLWSLQWWAQAIGYLPVTLLLLSAVWALLRRIQDDWRWGSPLAWGFVLLALAFQERALLAPVVLGGVALVLGDGRPVVRIGETLRRYWRLWLSLLVLLAGFVALHQRIAPAEAGVGDGGTPVIDLATDFVLRTLLPGLVGGPWRAQTSRETLVPETWAVVVGVLVAAGVVCWTAWRGGSGARWAWLMLAAYVVADIAILYGGRTQYGLDLGLLPRYVADVVPVATIALACAVASARQGVLPRAPRRAAVLATAALAVYVGSAAVSTTMMAPRQLNEDSREYVENLRSDLRANPKVVLYDADVPQTVMIGAFLEHRRVSTVLANAPENPVFDIPSRAMRVPDQEGRLRPVVLAFPTEMEPVPRDDDCGYHVTPGGVTIPFVETAEADRWVLRLEYFGNLRTTLQIETDGDTQAVAIRPGAASVDAVVSGDIDEVRLALDATAGTVCVTSATVGFPQPLPAEGP